VLAKYAAIPNNTNITARFYECDNVYVRT